MKEICNSCPARVDCIQNGTSCHAVKVVMEMVIGDYLGMLYYQEPDQTSVTPKEQEVFLQTFMTGCKEICEKFGIDWKALDVDHLLNETNH